MFDISSDALLSKLKISHNIFYTEGFNHYSFWSLSDQSTKISYDEWVSKYPHNKQNSIGKAPLFVSWEDLHLRADNNRGVPIAGFGFDIEGVNRDQQHTDIGAYEFVEQTLQLSVNDACVRNPNSMELNSADVFLTYKWDFGDGTLSWQAKPTHIYKYPGSYTVKLFVTKADYSTQSFSKQITIHPQPQTSAIHHEP